MNQSRLLNHYHFGDQTGVPLVVVHGLFGSARNWRAIARFLSRNRWVVTVDLRNHGESFWAPENSYFDLASDLEVLINHFGGKADVLGHSMGGKAAMILALTHEHMVNRLVIADIAPIGYQHSQNAGIKIMQSLNLESFDRRSEAQKELEAKTNDPNLAAFFAQSISFEENAPKWQLNLQALHENMDAIIGFPALESSFSNKSLFISGQDSDYVSEHGLLEIERLFTNNTLKTIERAGHWLHADQPRAFMQSVEDWLS